MLTFVRCNQEAAALYANHDQQRWPWFFPRAAMDSGTAMHCPESRGRSLVGVTPSWGGTCQVVRFCAGQPSPGPGDTSLLLGQTCNRAPCLAPDHGGQGLPCPLPACTGGPAAGSAQGPVVGGGDGQGGDTSGLERVWAFTEIGSGRLVSTVRGSRASL